MDNGLMKKCTNVQNAQEILHKVTDCYV